MRSGLVTVQGIFGYQRWKRSHMKIRSKEMIELKSRKFLVLVVAVVAMLAVVCGVVVAVTGSGKGTAKSGTAAAVEKDVSGSSPTKAVTNDCQFNDNGTCTKTGEPCTDCINTDPKTGTTPGTGTSTTVAPSSGGLVVDCPNNDNGTCTKTGEPCTNCIGEDLTTSSTPE
jgi:hypothetical protein